MPAMQTATTMMNIAFSPEGLREFTDDTRGLFDPYAGVKLPEALRRIGHLDLPEAVVQFIEGWPSALQAAVQAVIWENFQRDATVPITFAWSPAYDYSVTIYDVHDTDKSRGGITVLLTSRYPDDVHPLSVSGT